MKNKLLSIAVLALLFRMFPITSLGADITNSESLPESYQRLANAVEKNFKQAADTLMAIPDLNHQMPDWETLRALKTQLWLQLLDQVDATRNFNFDFNDFRNGPFANVAPPDIRYNSGIDPAAIKEPLIRQAYEDAIRENRAVATRLEFERKLKILDEQLTGTAIQYFNSVYEKTPEDSKNLVTQLGILENPQHKAQMEKMLQDFINLAKEEK